MTVLLQIVLALLATLKRGPCLIVIPITIVTGLTLPFHQKVMNLLNLMKTVWT